MATTSMAMAGETKALQSIYVGDLHPLVVENVLMDAFREFKSVASVKVCRDMVTRLSLCYGYVNFLDQKDAIRAIEVKNHTPLYGKPMRIKWSYRNSDGRNSGIGNVFVKNLCDSIDDSKLQEIFGEYGNISSCKVATTDDGKSRGFGFIQFISEEFSNAAIENLNGVTIGGKEIYVAKFVKKSDRLVNSESLYTNLYMKNLDSDISEEVLNEKFSKFGKIVSLAIAKDENGASKGFGFVNFENPDEARYAKEAMNGSQLGSKTLYVARAQKKTERTMKLRQQLDEKKREKVLKSMGLNVYVKNIHDDVNDEELQGLFNQCGTITSAIIMRDAKGLSTGFGFVCFSTPGEASKAVSTFNGQMFHQKPLYVAIAQRKADRQVQLRIQHAQRLAGFPGPSTPLVPGGYPPLYFAPAAVPQVPPQTGLVYHQPMGIRPNWRAGTGFLPSPAPGFLPPLPPMFHGYLRPKRQNSRGRINGHTLPQHGGPMQPMVLSRESAIHQRNGPVRYAPNFRHELNRSSGMSSPSTASNGTSCLPDEDWSSMLSSVEPERQKELIGERLYPLVHDHRPDLAAKITGLLLEMDNSELMLMVYSPELLAAKVEEAVKVLKLANISNQQGPVPTNHDSDAASQ
ncbi:hypothetical protein Droror1_Dr00013858 [Drosera rotundifolia]